MGKIMKQGRVVIVLAGRHAGKKAVVVRHFDEGKKDKKAKFAQALVAGVERYPLKVTKRMSSKRIEKRSRLKAFVKTVNYNHLLPTRYMLNQDFEFKGVVSDDKLQKIPAKKATMSADDKQAREDALKSRKTMKQEVRKLFQEKYKQPRDKADKTNHVGFFFKKLRF